MRITRHLGRIAGIVFLSVLTAQASYGALVTITGTITRPDGTHPSGSMNIQSQAFTNAQGQIIHSVNILNVPIVNGVFSVALEPNIGASPDGTSYRVTYSLAGSIVQNWRWFVPVSNTPVDYKLVQFPVAGLVGTTAVVGLSQLTQGGATTGQGLCFNGSQWAPGSCNVGVVTPATTFLAGPTSGAPNVSTFRTITLADLPAGIGGVSNVGALTLNQLVIGQGTNMVAALGTAGTSSTLLHGGSPPTFGQIVNADIGSGAVNLTTNVTAVLPGTNGGLGANASAFTGLLKMTAGVAAVASAVTDYAVPTNGTNNQLLTSDGNGGFGAAVTPSPCVATDCSNASNIGSGTLASARLSANVVRTDQANTYTAGAQDFGAAASLKLPVGAGLTTTVNGQVGYDSTNNFLHLAINGTDRIALFRSTALPVNGDCMQWGAVGIATDSGASCGAGGGGSADPSALNCGVGITATVLTVFKGATASQPCNVRFGDTVIQIIQAATSTITAGAGNGVAWVYILAGGSAFIDRSTAAGITTTDVNLTSQNVADPTTPGPPQGYYLLAKVTITAGAWVVPTGNADDWRSFLGRDAGVAGDGVTISAAGVTAVDSTVARRGATNAFTGVNDFTAGSVVLPGMTFATLADGATITWAIASKQIATGTVTLGGNRTLNITNPLSGGQYVLKIVQDGTGSRGLVLGTGCTWKVSGGGSGAITPSTAAGAIDTLVFIYDGANCYANLNKNYN